MKTAQNIKIVEAEGFRDGSQEVSPETTLQEIDKHFSQLQEEEKIATSDRIRTLEGNIENLEQRKFDTDRHWSNLESSTDGMPPQVVLPFCAVVLSILVIVGETLFLAPVMDGFGVGDPLWQSILAGVVVVVFSGLLEITKRQWQVEPDEMGRNDGSRGSRRKWLVLIPLNLLALMFVSFLGWWRAEEMIYAASASNGSWQKFLADNATLTRVVVVLLTVSLPIFVAIAFDWGLSALRFAAEWRKTRRAYRRFTKELAAKAKELEAEQEKTAMRQQLLADRADEWKQSYLQNHELGKAVGARRMPLWHLLLKITAVVLILCVISFLVDPWLSAYIASDAVRYFLDGCFVLGFGFLFGCYFFKSWDRPNVKQLYSQRAVNWRNPTRPSLPDPSESRSQSYSTVTETVG